MNFLLSGCQNPDILRIILFFKKILDIVTIILPIALIIFLIIDLAKMIIAGDDKQQGKTIKTIITRIVFAILIFFVPTIVNVVMTLISGVGIEVGENYKTCFDNATIDIINDLQKIQDEEDKIEEEKKQLQQQQQQNNKDNNETPPNNSIKDIQTGELYHDLAQEMISVAVSEVGKTNGSTYSTYWGGAAGEPWCAAFVMWVAANTNAHNVNLYYDIFEMEMKIPAPRVALSATYTFNESSHLTFYNSESQGGTYIPKKGDLVFIDRSGTWNKNNITSSEGTGNSHVAIVKTVFTDTKKIETIDGNYDGKVSLANYNLNDNTIIGYGAWYR